MVKDYILDIVHLNNDFTGNGMFMALYFVTLLFIAFYIEDRRLKRLILYPSMVLIAGIYVCLPAVNRFVFHVYDDEIRGRFNWLFMATAIAAMGGTLMVSAVKGRKKQVLLTISLIPVIFLSGVFQITDYRFQKATNLYKLPQAYVDVAEAILEDQREKGDGTAKLIAPYETAYAFRQYSYDIELLFGEDATYGRIWDLMQASVDSYWSCEHMITNCPDLWAIGIAAENHDMEYIMFDCTYTDFGLESINVNGYTEDENFVGDRTQQTESIERMRGTVNVTTDPETGNPCWDLSAWKLEYMGTYERYLLYRYVRD